MESSGVRRVSLALALGAALALMLPAQADHQGGGGHSGGGGFGGGHSSGGGHSMGGGAHSAGGGARFSGYSSAHTYMAPRFASVHAPVHGSFAGTSAMHAAGAQTWNGGAYWGAGQPYGGGRYWAGGYWNGGYWPRCYYGPGVVWFMPVLPFGFATFWWGGFPYYYWNNVYYTWSPGYNGYVVTDPPPVTDSNGSAEPEGGDAAYSDPADAAAPPSAPEGTAGADVYVYPRNGQSDEQTRTDRSQCHGWAANQVRAGNPGAYRRALIACLDARGYSAR